MTKLNSNQAWEKIIEKNNIVNQIKRDGFYEIKASQIKEFREPRLMETEMAMVEVWKDTKRNNLDSMFC